MKGIMYPTKRTATHNVAMTKTVTKLVTLLIGIGLAKAQMEALRDGGLVRETATFLPHRDASCFHTVWPMSLSVSTF